MEGRDDKKMNAMNTPAARFQTHDGIAAPAEGLSANDPTVSYSSPPLVGRDAVQGADAPHVRDFVCSLESDDRTPFLARQVAARPALIRVHGLGHCADYLRPGIHLPKGPRGRCETALGSRPATKGRGGAAADSTPRFRHEGGPLSGRPCDSVSGSISRSSPASRACGARSRESGCFSRRTSQRAWRTICPVVALRGYVHRGSDYCSRRADLE